MSASSFKVQKYVTSGFSAVLNSGGTLISASAVPKGMEDTFKVTDFEVRDFGLGLAYQSLDS